MCGVNTGSYTDIPPDSNTEYTWELLIFIHCSLYMIEVRLWSLVEQILCSSVGLFGCQKMKVSSLRWEERTSEPSRGESAKHLYIYVFLTLQSPEESRVEYQYVIPLKVQCCRVLQNFAEINTEFLNLYFCNLTSREKTGTFPQTSTFCCISMFLHSPTTDKPNTGSIQDISFLQAWQPLQVPLHAWKGKVSRGVFSRVQLYR